MSRRASRCRRTSGAPSSRTSSRIALLQVVAHVGGIVAGAFAADGELVGFVFGLTGSRNGDTIHWSHALGVRESARNAGVGRMLKEHQRAELARRGISTLYWTFDPLMAKNAHFNLNRLGARVVEYVENMYGNTGQPAPPRPRDRPAGRVVVHRIAAGSTSRGERAAHRRQATPILTPEPRTGDVVARIDAPERPATLWLEVPPDIQRESRHATHRARGTRPCARTSSGRCGTATTLTGLHRDPLTSRSFYVLERSAGAPA